MNLINPIKAQQRLSLHKQGHTNKQIAEITGETYQTICTWFSSRKIKGHKLLDVNGENERRYKAYLECRTDQEAADKLGIKKETFASWRWNHGMPSKRKQRKRNDSSYVSKRPDWEKARMRHFGSFLERLPEVLPHSIHNVIEIYREGINA